MKVILLNSVPHCGQKGEIKEVSDGYFLNFLGPRKLAAPATSSLVSHLQAQAAKAKEKLEVMKESAESIRTKVEGKTIKLEGKAREGGKLYAAVSKKGIAEAISDQLKVEIPEKIIELSQAIKEVGEFPLKLRLHKDISASLTVHVTAA